MSTGSTTPPAAGPRPGDARIAERRSEVARSRRHHRLARIGAVGLAVAIALSGFALLHSPVFAARHVTVVGAVHESDGVVRTAAGLSGRPPLIDVHPAVAARAIEALPWVRSATVTREWPEGVRVEVTERTAVGVSRLAHATGYALLDGSGRVLADAPTAPGSLLPIEGVGHLPAPGGTLTGPGVEVCAAAAALPASLRTVVRGVGWIAHDGVAFSLTSGAEVLLGSTNDLGQKFTALATLLVERAAVVATARLVDLRVPLAPVLTPR